MAKMTEAERAALPTDKFAFPRTRQGPLVDATHVRLAWDMIDRTKGVTDQERGEARRRVLREAKSLGLDTSSWNKLKAMRFEIASLDAMALNIPHVDDHPNRMPFSGVLTKLDQPSDRPVHGSLGKLVVIPRAVAEAALPSLLGMAVDFQPGLDGHDPRAKIGIFTDANIDGDDLRVAGFLYAADFPDEVAQIQADTANLGFSYETAQNFVESLDDEFLVLSACTFTGAAILKKASAAYQTTSLAASAAGDIEMTKEELAEAIAAAIKADPTIASLAASQTKIVGDLQASKEVQAKVKPHADALRACADGMQAAGIGGHPTGGHVARLNKMADSMEASAAMGEVPSIYRDHDYAGGSWSAAAPVTAPETPAEKALKDELASLKTKVADLTASAVDKAGAPERKTLSPHITALLAKAGGAPGADGKVPLHSIDAAMAAAHMEPRERMAMKRQLQLDGMLAE